MVVGVAEDELLDVVFQEVGWWWVGLALRPPNLKHLLAELLIHLDTLGHRHLEQAEQDGEDATLAGATDEVEQLVGLLVGAGGEVLKHTQRDEPSDSASVDAKHSQSALIVVVGGGGHGDEDGREERGIGGGTGKEGLG
jgi:hypothetical protein